MQEQPQNGCSFICTTNLLPRTTLLLQGVLFMFNFAVSLRDSGASDVRTRPPRPR